MRVLFACWPGTLAAWMHGDVRSLMIALVYGAILCLSWVGIVLWPMWIPSWRVYGLAGIAGGAALVSLIHNVVQGNLRSQRRRTGCPDGVLSEAQELYLQANYFEAEQRIAKYCQGRTLDPEATLLLASIMRRTQRFAQAIELLETLQRLDCGRYWNEEIDSELARSKQQKVRAQSESL